ncbi:MAG: GGDEF domain-containing protein [Lachnospiraceae bacterium]|nr:GGDEF domain-containing protein [Lachnospiraceae bacterium]MBR4084343.1 GGDEF domain-containing protein [Lachnospiraceae bacterium]
MNDHAFISSFRKKKILQLSLFIILEFFFLLFLVLYLISSGEALRGPMRIIMSCILSGFFILSIVFLLYDLKQLKKFSGFSKQWEQMAYIDKSGIHNRYSLDLLFQSYSTPESLENVGCCLFTIKNLEEINKKAGREAGDEVIKDFCNILDESGAKYGFVGRNGGNEFIIVLENCTKATMSLIYAAMDKRLHFYNERHPQLPIKINRAFTLNAKENCSSFFGLLTATYSKLQ